jgi:signal transduction histidine kinase
VRSTLSQRWRSIAAFPLEAIVIAAGWIVLLGWLLDVASLKGPTSNLPAMKANSAFAFVVAGASLWVLRSPSAGRRLHRLARGGAALVLLLGAATLAEYASGLSLGIDELVFHDASTLTGAAVAGRMGVNTAGCFVLVGLSLLLLDVEWRRIRPAQVGALIVGVVGFVAVLGYLYGAATLERSGFVPRRVMPMALHTALVMLLLGGSVLRARPGKGFLRLAAGSGAGSIVFKRMLPLVVVLPAALGYLQLKGQRAGFYGTEVGTALLAGSLTFSLGGLLWTLARALERADAKQRETLDTIRVIEAQKLESLGVLAGGIAHDFNNLLVGVLFNARLVFDELPPASRLRTQLTDIESAVERAATLTRQMLAYAGKGHFVVEQVDLGATVQEMTSLMRAAIPKNVELVTEIAPDLPPIKADSAQLTQVVMNLIINAAEATGDKDAAVQIAVGAVDATPEYLARFSLSQELAAGRYVIVEVNDAGSGMDEGTLARIFEPFFSTKFTGRGLGLAATLGIIRAHSGAISVESRPGGGSSFRVLFPVATGEAGRGWGAETRAA